MRTRPPRGKFRSSSSPRTGDEGVYYDVVDIQYAVVRTCDRSKTRRNSRAHSRPSTFRQLPTSRSALDDFLSRGWLAWSQIRITRVAVWHSTRARPRGHAYRLGVCALACAPVPLASFVSSSFAFRVSPLALARSVNERKDVREASPSAPEPLPRGAHPRGVGQDGTRGRRRALLRLAETYPRRPRDRLGAHRPPPSPPALPSERHLELPRVARISPPPPTPATVEPSPPDAAHLRPSPRSPRAVS